MNNRTRNLLAAAALAAPATAHAQYVSDGNLNNLPVGTAPDCATPAGAWQFPANYSTLAVCEALPEQVTIVPTSSFQPGATGNSLRMSIGDPAINVHAINLFDEVIEENVCLATVVNFRIWVPSTALAGASVYVGADHGGGGFGFSTDRGPQVAWRADGTIAYVSFDTAGNAVYTTLVNSYPRNAWQNVTLIVKMTSDTFHMMWAPSGQPLQEVGTNLRFRSPTGLDHIDRFTVAYFGATFPSVESYIDDLEVGLAGPACYANCDNSSTHPILNVADFTCFLQRFAAGDSYANCDGSTAQPVLNVADFTCFLQQFAFGCDC